MRCALTQKYCFVGWSTSRSLRGLVDLPRVDPYGDVPRPGARGFERIFVLDYGSRHERPRDQGTPISRGDSGVVLLGSPETFM